MLKVCAKLHFEDNGTLLLCSSQSPSLPDALLIDVMSAPCHKYMLCAGSPTLLYHMNGLIKFNKKVFPGKYGVFSLTCLF